VKAADVYGKLLIWEEPQPLGVYVLPMDCSEGAGQDYHHGGVIRIDQGPSLVAEYRTNQRQFGGGLFAVKMYLLGLYYNYGLIICERNAVGMVAIQTFLDGHPEFPHTVKFKYSNFYRYTRKDRRTQEEEEVIGFWTSQSAKETGMDHLADMIHFGRYKVFSTTVINQLRGFCKNPQKAGRNKWQEKFQDPVSRLYNDDGVMMMMMGEEARRYLLEQDATQVQVVA
jgi:hypothetical protein